MSKKKQEGKKVDAARSAAGKRAHEERMAAPLAGLAAARAALGWSKAKAADACGISVTTYARIEGGLAPFPDQADAIAAAFGVAVADLAGSPAGGSGRFESVRLASRITALEAEVGRLSGDVGAAMEGLGGQKSDIAKLARAVSDLASAMDVSAGIHESQGRRLDAIEDGMGAPMVLDRNGVPLREGGWYVDRAEEVPAKAAPRYIAGVELHEVEGKGLLAYIPNGLGQYGIASVVDGRCPTLAAVDIVERGKAGSR